MMHRTTQLVIGLTVAALHTGCRTATRVIEEPRVDLDLTSGNRGYLIGTPPSVSAERPTTRQMVETELEVPSFYRPSKGQMQRTGLQDVAPPEVVLSAEPSEPMELTGQSYDTYVVKPGDTLWSIAADPAVLGDGTKWRQLFEVNHDQLKSPDRLRAGMTIRIPQGEAAMQPSSSHAAPYTK